MIWFLFLVLDVGQESNLRPLVLETNALPIELPTHSVTKGGIEPPHKLHELILYRCTSVRTSIPSLAHYCTGCDPIQTLCHLSSVNYPFSKCLFSFCAGDGGAEWADKV